MSTARIVSRTIILLSTALAGYLVYRTLRSHSPDDILQSIRALPLATLLLSQAFAVLSYLCLGSFDVLAIAYVKGRVPPWRAAFASFVSLSIGHNVGLAALSSGALRYRYYSRWGLPAEAIARIILLCGVTVGLGLATLAGIFLLLRPERSGALLGLSPAEGIGVGLLALMVPAGYILLSVFARAPVRFRKWTFEMPRPWIACGQVAVGTLNYIFVSACLWELLRAEGDVAYIDVVGTYVTAILASIVTHVPGGLGVIETTVQHLLAGKASIGALIAFRVIYFFLPLFVGLVLLVGGEIYFRAVSRGPAPSEPNQRVSSIPARARI